MVGSPRVWVAYPLDMTYPGTLEMRRRPRFGIALWLLAAVVVALVAAWFVTHPEELPVSDETIRASTPVGQPVYIGVFAPTVEFGRTLHLSGVKVHTTSNVQVTVTPLVCKGGTIGVTSAPETFCTELVNPEGASVGPGDNLVLQVSGDLPAIAVIDRIRLGYREGLQTATQEAGADAIVSIVSR